MWLSMDFNPDMSIFRNPAPLSTSSFQLVFCSIEVAHGICQGT